MLLAPAYFNVRTRTHDGGCNKLALSAAIADLVEERRCYAANAMRQRIAVASDA